MSSKSEQVRDYFSTLIGTEINGTYRIGEKLGSGGMGAVFKGTHIEQGNCVAIKIISPFLAANQVFVKRFKRKAKVGWALSHPNVVKVCEFGETKEGLLYMVMGYVEGETLTDSI